jgi:hypothetical protein
MITDTYDVWKEQNHIVSKHRHQQYCKQYKQHGNNIVFYKQYCKQYIQYSKQYKQYKNNIVSLEKKLTMPTQYCRHKSQYCL